MTENQIQHTLEMYHRKAMREPTRRLRAVIEQASKRRCWYNGWKREGELADYGILHEPMRKFLSEAKYGDICAMCEFLMAKANAQVEKSDDEGDCAGQARYWMEKLLKALMKSEANIVEKTAWLEDFQKRDRYFLADYAKTMLNKRNTLSQEDWSRLADMKIERFKNSPKLDDDGRSDEDIHGWLDDKEAVAEVEAALRNAGRAGEITDFRKSILGRFGTAEDVAEALLADGRVQESESWFAKGLEQDPTSMAVRARLREFALSRGDLLTVAAYDAESFFDDPTIDAYDQLMAICTAVGLTAAVRAEVFRSLESGIRPDFAQTKTDDWPLPIVALRRNLVEEPSPDFSLLSELSWREHRPKEAILFYKRELEQRKKVSDKQVWNSDWLMADRIAQIWPEEAMTIWESIIQNSMAAYQSDYDNIVRALKCMKPILFISGRAKEFQTRVRNMIESNKRRRNLVEALEKL